jgi:beta-galactosidase
MPNVTRRDVLLSGIAVSGSTLLSSHALAQSHALMQSALGDQALAALAPREKLLFDFDWKFTFGNADDASKDLGFGNNLDAFSKTGTFKFAYVKYDDSKWHDINLPHDWAVELPFVWDQKLMSHGYKPLGRSYPATSVGWYRRIFDIPESDRGRRLVLQFDGAQNSAIVFVNGCYIGRNTNNGYAPFTFDITDFVRYGQKNCLTVRMDASYGDGWFYEGAGIYRHVWLVKQDKLHLGQWESYIRPMLNDDHDQATLELGTVVNNQHGKNQQASIHWEIKDPSGKTVATAQAPAQNVPVDGSATFTASAKLSHPELWSPETPTLYTAVVTVMSNGATRDAEQVTFGVRSIRFDANKGFFLNGKSTPIQGTCNHQDHAGVGAALPDRLQYFRASVLKEMGCNAVRTSHNMPTPEWVEACNRLGLMMMCETRQMSANPSGMHQLELMIKRYRNSPAIILWSMGNEEWVLQKSPIGSRIMEDMVRRSHELDPTRMCTAAVNGAYKAGISDYLDVEGFNYNLPKIDEYHKTHPDRPLVGSETASALSERGIYRTDKLRNWMSAYDTNQPGWGETAEDWWQFYAAREFLPGGFAWTGFDYRGEPTPYSWPAINSYFGIVDTCGFPKDTFYYYQSVWGNKPMLHVFPHWNFQGEEGNSIPVWAYSNLDEVELFVNGKSLGRQKMPHLSHVKWDVKYEPGYIEAHAYKNGKLVLKQKRETTGDPASIRLTADRTTINADGEDLAIIRVEALDAQGRFVPTANELIHFKITGDGALIGVGNGDPNSHESDKAPMRSIFNGLAQVILQANKTPGQITIEATGDRPHLKSATLTITTQQAPIRPEVS